MTKSNRTDPETQAEQARRIGALQGKFRAIRLAEPRQFAAVAAMEQLRASSVGRPDDAGTRALVIIQPSGAGKSEAIKQFKSFVESEAGRDPSKKPVLHVTLETIGTPRSVIVSILEALGDQYAQVGTEPLLLARLRKAIEREGVEILIIDELNHVSQKIMGRDVSNLLKNMLTKGWVPIVFAGTSDAQRLFKDNRELRNRSQPQLSLAPFDHTDVDHLKGWASFLAGLDAQIVELKLLPRLSLLGAPDLAEALCETCRGLIGELSLVIEDGLAAAAGRRADRISIADLHRSVEERYVMSGDLGANPLDRLLSVG